MGGTRQRRRERRKHLQNRTGSLYLPSHAEEADFIDYMHELMRDDNEVVSRTATAIFCKFIGISVSEFNEDTRRMRELIPLIDETFGKQEP